MPARQAIRGGGLPHLGESYNWRIAQEVLLGLSTRLRFQSFDFRG